RVSGRSELRRSDSGDLVQELPKKVTSLYQLAKSAPISYFRVNYGETYKDESEVRRTDTAEIVLSGTHIHAEEHAQFVYAAASGAEEQILLPTDHPGVPIKLSHHTPGIDTVEGMLWMLVRYFGEDQRTELRKLDGQIVETYSQVVGQEHVLEANHDHSLFCV